MMEERELLSILEELKDYEEASDALLELKHLNPPAAENYCRQTLQNEAGDVYYRAILLDTLYSLNRSFALSFVLENLDRLPDYVLAAALSNVVVDESIVPDSEDLRVFISRMLSYIEQKSFPPEVQDIFSEFSATFDRKKTMIRLKDALVAERNEALSLESVLAVLGEPEIFTKAYKSYPTMLVYGDAEFRFRNGVLEIITITFGPEGAKVPPQLDVEAFQSIASRNFSAIETLLNQQQLSWKKDTIMSDEDQEVYITEHAVHLAFYKGVLTKVGIAYGKNA